MIGLSFQTNMFGFDGMDFLWLLRESFSSLWEEESRERRLWSDRRLELLEESPSSQCFWFLSEHSTVWSPKRASNFPGSVLWPSFATRRGNKGFGEGRHSWMPKTLVDSSFLFLLRSLAVYLSFVRRIVRVFRKYFLLLHGQGLFF